ncbi:pentapeptide repeat-containing protein [Streptomyces sp. NPDC018964]|uniref:pentapeptide repeat-containing protein n=1 Tax=Streptomyces sp. NPDC018964 TaxID=3365058 RepID=UPI0037A21F37
MRWAELLAASLPGLAALLALLFTWIQVTQAGKELAISERGQITSRFNAAVSNLGAASADVRLGGIYALEQIMRDSAPDQPAVVSVLSAYARHNAPVRVEDARKAPVLPGDEPRPLSADLQAVMTVLGNRRPDRDRGVQIDLSRTALPGLELSGYPGLFPLRGVDLREADLSSADFRYVDLRNAALIGVDLSGASLLGSRLDEADLEDADLTQADLVGAELDGAHLSGADLTGTVFCSEEPPADSGTGSHERFCAEMSHMIMTGVNLAEADLAGANLARTYFCPDPDSSLIPSGKKNKCTNLVGVVLNSANLKEAYLSRVSLRGADLRGADLRGADLTGANLRGADLTDADLSGADLEDADLRETDRTGADFTNADLTGVKVDGAGFEGGESKRARGLSQSS